MKKFIEKHKNLISYIVIIVIGLYLGIPLFSRYLNVYYDDGIQHIARAFGQNKSNTFMGNVIVSFTNGFGYSWNLFYGPLSSFGINILHVITHNYISAYKLLLLICMILSGVSMYIFIKTTSKNHNTALLAAIIYMAFPYHLTDMYIRNALGEYISFCFIPLVFLGLYNLLKTNDNSYHFIIGMVGLILTHNISSILVTIFGAFYIIANLELFIKKNVLKEFFIDIFFILLITSFYWAPFIETAVSTDYQVYEEGMMSTSAETAEHGLSLNQLFVSKNNGTFIFELGPHIWIMLALSVMAFRLVSKDHKNIYVVFLVSALLSIWMSTKYFPWKWLPKEFSFIQFPWRMSMMSGFFLSGLCAYNMTVIIKNFNIKDVAVVTVIAVGYMTAFYPYLKYDTGIQDIDKYTLGVMSGKEVETVAGTAKAEYLPVNAYNHRFDIATRDDNTYVISGKAIIEDEVKNGAHYEAKIENLADDYTVFELPYIYYPGYTLRFDGIRMKYFESDKGFIECAIPKNETGVLTADYTGSNTMRTSMLLSVVSTIACIGFTILKTKKNKEIVEK